MSKKKAESKESEKATPEGEGNTQVLAPTVNLGMADLKELLLQVVTIAQANGGQAPESNGGSNAIESGLERIIEKLDKTRPVLDVEEAMERKRRKHELPRGDLGYRDVKELHDMVAMKDFVPFYIGMSPESPFKSYTILGVDFPKVIGKWDDEERQLNLQRGVIKRMPRELAHEIKLYARNIWFKGTLVFFRRYDEDVDREYLHVDQRLDAFHENEAAQIRNGKAQSKYVKDKKGRELEKWFCLADFILLEERSEGDYNVDPTQALYVENRSLRDRIQDLEDKLAEGKLQTLKDISAAHQG